MRLFDLTGKVALVTGGNGGIGKGIAVGLAEAGASVCIVGRNPAKNEAAVAEISSMGQKAQAVSCDVNDKSDIDQAIASTLDAFGGLDILVNNAGIAQPAAPESMDDETWANVIDTNLTSVFRFSRAAYPQLVASGGGKIINIGSMYSLFGGARAANYSAAKGGVVQLTKSLAVAWADKNIQVNALLPGWITTDMTAPIEQHLPEWYQSIVDRTPARRFGEPEECAGTAVFLASSASDFVTGQSVAVCGGYSIA